MDLISPSLCHDEDSALFLEALARLRDAEGPVGLMRDVRDTHGPRIALAFWRALVEQGWTAATLPEGMGGLGLSEGVAVLGARELGRTLVPVPFNSSCVVVPTLLSGTGATEAADLFLSDAGGWWGLALHEADAFSLGSGPTLSGTMPYCADVVGATEILCRATGPDGPVLALVSASDAEILDQDLADRRNRGRITLANAPARILAQGETAVEALSRAEALARMADAAEMLGIAEASFALALDYLKTRKQFGALIGSFQALQHRAARAFSELECARGLLWKAVAADAVDQTELSLLAKAEIGRIACLVVSEAFQFHGGIAMTDEFDMGLYLKRLRVVDAMGGNQSRLQDQLGQLWGY